MVKSESVNFGPVYGSRASDVRYEVTSPDGMTIHIATTGTSVIELVIGSGNYAAPINLDPSWGDVLIHWTMVGTTLSASSGDNGSPTPAWASPGDTPNGGFTYDPSAIATSAKDWIRFALQDNDPVTAVLGDAEINGLVGAVGVRAAFVQCANAAASEWDRRAMETNNDQTKTLYNLRGDRFRSLANLGLVMDIPTGLEGYVVPGTTASGIIQTPCRRELLNWSDFCE